MKITEHDDGSVEVEIQDGPEWDCARGGHRYAEVMVMESVDPIVLVCSDCGRYLTVNPHKETQAPEDLPLATSGPRSDTRP